MNDLYLPRGRRANLVRLLAATLETLGYREVRARVAPYMSTLVLEGTVRDIRPDLSALWRDEKQIIGEIVEPNMAVVDWQPRVSLLLSANYALGYEIHFGVPNTLLLNFPVQETWERKFRRLCARIYPKARYTVWAM